MKIVTAPIRPASLVRLQRPLDDRQTLRYALQAGIHAPTRGGHSRHRHRRNVVNYCVFIALTVWTLLLLFGVPILWATISAGFVWILLDALSDTPQRR